RRPALVGGGPAGDGARPQRDGAHLPQVAARPRRCRHRRPDQQRRAWPRHRLGRYPVKLLARTVSVVCVLTAVAGCSSSAPPVGPGAVRWRWRPPSPASVGMPAGDQSNVAATYGHLRLVLFSSAGIVQWQAERLGLREEAPLLLP